MHLRYEPDNSKISSEDWRRWDKELEEGKKTTEIKYRGLIDPNAPDTTQLRCSSIPSLKLSIPCVVSSIMSMLLPNIVRIIRSTGIGLKIEIRNAMNLISDINGTLRIHVTL